MADGDAAPADSGKLRPVMATEDAVTKIIEGLKESDELPRKQIAEIVEVLGPEVSLELLAETRRVQDEGGIAVRDGTRRRTDGGVFFSLAKGKLPKTDRNRIFRVRVPKPVDESAEAAPSNVATPPPPPKAPVIEARRPRPGEAPAVRDAKAAPDLGRRRVVEVEVLRTHVKPPVPVAPEARAPAPPVVQVKEERHPAPELRPVRRIITVAPVVKEEPPATPQAARERVLAVVKGLSAGEQRKVIADVLRELGGVVAPEAAKHAPEPRRAPEPKRQEPSGGLDAGTRERVLAAVTDALGLSTTDLARVLYGDETPGAKAKARGALDRFRKS